MKRLSDVFEDEVKRVAEKFGDEETAKELIAKDHSLVPCRLEYPGGITCVKGGDSLH